MLYSQSMKDSCHCGNIKFEVKGKWSWIGRCHCRDCQKISGTAYMTFVCFDSTQVEFLEGNRPKAYKSSPAVTRTFCEKCGSPIEWTHDSEPSKTNLTLGLFDRDYEFEVVDDLYEEESPLWSKRPK